MYSLMQAWLTHLLQICMALNCYTYSMMVATRPEPTVRPPSRIAKRKTLLHSDRMDQFDGHLYVITRHTHLNTSGQFANAGNVGGSEVELRTIVVEERSMTSTFILGQNVYLSGKLSVAGNSTGLSQNLSSFDFSSLDTTKQSTDVITSLCLIQHLTEHFDTGYNSLTWSLP